MESNGNIREATWCSLIRSWYCEIDDAGISLNNRIQKMLNIRSYLLPFLKVGHFPPHGFYVAGLPIAQSEGILTNVDRRIQLYSTTKIKTYNQRAITSLDSWDVFSLDFRYTNLYSCIWLIWYEIRIIFMCKWQGAMRPFI